MQILFRYCKSHIYELHALLAATIAFFLMFPLKKPIKEQINRWVDRRAKVNIKWQQHRMLYRKRCNIIILFLTVLLSGLLFVFISAASPFIHFSWYMTWMSGAFALTEYALYDQCFIERKGL